MAFDHSTQDDAAQRHGGLQWIADHVDHVVPVEPFAVAEPVGMKDHEHVQLLDLPPERGIRRVVVIHPLGAGVDRHARKAVSGGNALEFGYGPFG